MKKENYVERIKEMDRYIQKINKVQTELNFILNEKPWNRISFDNFKEKYEEEIITMFSYPPPISPKEFKLAVYKITRFHSELINNTYPWYSIKKIGDIEVFEMTGWGRQIVISYHNYIYYNNFLKFICCACKIPNTKFNNYKKYNDQLFYQKKKETKEKINEVLEQKDLKNSIPDNLKNDLLYEEFTNNLVSKNNENNSNSDNELKESLVDIKSENDNKN